MRFPNKLWQAQASIAFEDVSGNPSVAMGKDNSIYFAASVSGSNPIAGTTNNYDIAVGKLDANGTVVWYMLFPELNTPTDETDPVVALGPDDEMYVAYVTRGSTNNNFNMEDQITFCPFVCTDRGPEDIAIARIDTVGSPVMRWVVQHGRFNSCNRETVPSISVDKRNGLLYVGYQSSGNIQCNTSLGRPNVAIVCLNLSGDYYWTDSMSLNSPGVNQNAVVAADEFSNVYLAYQTRVKTQVGHIELVKYSTTQSNGIVNYTKEWRISDIFDMTSYSIDEDNPVPTVSKTPSIVCDAKGRVYLAFTTDGIMIGQLPTGSLHDLVIVSVEPNGTRRWIYQGPRYNEPIYKYIDCFTPYIACDEYGNLYVSLNTHTNNGYNIILYKLSPSGELLWSYTDVFNKTYNVYPIARDESIRPVLPTSLIPYKKMTLSVGKNMFVVAINVAQSIESQPASNLTLFAFDERLYFENMDAFGYMNTIKSGCGCSTNGCGC